MGARSASGRYTLGKRQARAFRLLCTKASSQCAEMEVGACAAVEGGHLVAGESSGAFCVRALAEGLAALEAETGLVERTFFKNLLALMLEGTRRFDEARLADLREEG